MNFQRVNFTKRVKAQVLTCAPRHWPVVHTHRPTRGRKMTWLVRVPPGQRIRWLETSGCCGIMAVPQCLTQILPGKDGLNKLNASLYKTEPLPPGKQPRRETECILHQRTKLSDLF